MDNLYTVDEMMNFLRVSRAKLYRLMEGGVIPFVQIEGQRRFIGGQVMTAIKRMQVQQVQSKMLSGRKDTLSVGTGTESKGRNYTLSDVIERLHAVNRSSFKALKQSKKRPYNLRASKNINKRRTK